MGPTPPGPGGSTAVLVGAGDIGECGSPGPAATAALLDGIEGTIFTTGDNAYFQGSATDFQNCYEPTWGRHKSRTRPVPGNHDYETPGASAYFNYFGTSAGPPGLGYYSYTVGPWRVVALNSEIAIGFGSTQWQWLRETLTTQQSDCTLAYFHRPLFSSGPNGGSPAMHDIWRVLYDNNVDVVLAGHDHLYERFAPQDPDGRLDTARGIRQFTVGTGGASLYAVGARRPNSEAAVSTFGVLKLTLTSGQYQWQFVAAVGGSIGDSGVGTCH